MQCSQCSCVLPDNAKFCRNCGAQTQIVPSASAYQPAPTTTACRQCGSVVEPSGRFCRKCGAAQKAAPNQNLGAIQASTQVRTGPPPLPKLSDSSDAAQVISPPLPPPVSTGLSHNAPYTETASAGATIVEAQAPFEQPVPPPVQPAPQPPYQPHYQPPHQQHGQASRAVPPRDSNVAMIVAIVAAVVLVVACGGGGYWWWQKTQAKAREELAIATQAAEDKQRNEAAEIERRVREASEKAATLATEQAEAKLKKAMEDAAAANLAAAPAPAPSVAVAPEPVSLLEQSSKCSDLEVCLGFMLKAVEPRRQEVMQMAAMRILDMPRPSKGDRKVARKFNTEGLTEIGNGNAAAAVTLFDQGVKADPSDVEIRSNLGLALIKAGRSQDAERALKDALLIDPRRTGAWVPMAEVLDLQGKTDAALKALLLGYEYSGNKEKTAAYILDKSTTAEKPSMKALFTKAIARIQSM